MFSSQSAHRSILRVKSKYQFLKFVNHPEDTEAIFKLTDTFQKAAEPEIVEKLISKLLENPKLKQGYEQRYWPHIPSLADLKNYPEGSFGEAAASFFVRWKLNPDLFPGPNFSTPQDYFTTRIYQAHDFWHVLTGYDISLESELALQAFGVGQYEQPISLAIIAGGIMHLLQKVPERSAVILAKISEGYERGVRAKNLLAEPVLERLSDPISDVRKDLGIVDCKLNFTD